MIPRNGPTGQWTKDVNEGMDIINELPSHQPDMRHILGYTLQKGKSLGCLGAAFTIKDSLFQAISCRSIEYTQYTPCDVRSTDLIS